MAAADSIFAQAATVEAAVAQQPEQAAWADQAEEAEQPQWSEAEKQTYLLRQILSQEQKQTRILQKMSARIADVEKATHFMERRQDSEGGLVSDSQRHAAQNKIARQAIADQQLTEVQRARQLRSQLQDERIEFADRQITINKGSLWMPCLQPVLDFYAARLAAQVAQDEADQAEEAAQAAEEAAQAAEQAAQPAEQAAQPADVVEGQAAEVVEGQAAQ